MRIPQKRFCSLYPRRQLRSVGSTAVLSRRRIHIGRLALYGDGVSANGINKKDESPSFTRTGLHFGFVIPKTDLFRCT